MSLSKAAPRKPLHQRIIDCHGYEREDGDWDIEGHLVDTKTYAFDNQWRGVIQADEPLHEMFLRITVNDDLEVLNAEAYTHHSPYQMCPNFPNQLPLLVGLKIAPGWNNAIRKTLGGSKGCTHITELLGRVANVAFQTVMPLVQKKKRSQITTKPRILDTCHALNSSSEVVKREWPQFYIEKSS